MTGACMQSQGHESHKFSDCDHTYHSLGGMTLTIPDFMPYLSIFWTKVLKLRNWSIVCKGKWLLVPYDP